MSLNGQRCKVFETWIEGDGKRLELDTTEVE